MKNNLMPFLAKVFLSAGTTTLSSAFEPQFRSILNIPQATVPHPIDGEFLIIFILSLILFSVFHSFFILFQRIILQIFKISKSSVLIYVVFSVVLLSLFCGLLHIPSLDPLYITALVGIWLAVVPFLVGELFVEKLFTKNT